MNRIKCLSAYSLLSIILSSCGIDGTADLTQSPNSSAGVNSPTPGISGAPSSTVQVSIPVNATGKGSAGYIPNPITISVGSTVTWINNDTAAPHTATSSSNPPLWDSGVLQLGQSFSFQFTSPGTYPYYCTIHGAASMNGTITVQ